MRAKRRLIDTPPAPLSLSLSPPPLSVSLARSPSPSAGFSSVVEHCFPLTSNYSPALNSSRSNFRKTIFLTVLRARIAAHLFLREAEPQDWNTGVERRQGKKREREKKKKKQDKTKTTKHLNVSRLCASNTINVCFR